MSVGFQPQDTLTIGPRSEGAAENRLRISFGIQSGNFSTATFRADVFYICTRGQNPGLSPVVPSGRTVIFGTKIELDTCPQNRSHSGSSIPRTKTDTEICSAGLGSH
jgi:hypothetical protein